MSFSRNSLATLGLLGVFLVSTLFRASPLIAIEPPVAARWDFESGSPVSLETQGNVRFGVPGPRPPEFPGFSEQNRAVRLEGKGAFLFVADAGKDSPFGFTNGDAITLEAWVKVDKLRGGSLRYLIDGQPTDGTWDLEGETQEPPVVDDDQVRIGSSSGSSSGNSFIGSIDQLAIHRVRLEDRIVASHFQRVGGPRAVVPRVVKPMAEAMPEVSGVPAGRVLVTVAEGLPSDARWLNENEEWPGESTRWVGGEFLLPRIPLRYDGWGIRSAWNAPLLVRIAADVDLPPGKHRFLLRARALSRLWVDGVVVARTDAITKQPPNGEEPITPIGQPPLPGVRVAGYHQQEAFGEVEILPGPVGPRQSCRVVLEMVVGGKNLRYETGEVCVGVLTDDRQSYDLLRPGEFAPLTNTFVDTALLRIERSLSLHDDQTRRQAAATQAGFWDQRHRFAREWAQRHAAPNVPPTTDDPAADGSAGANTESASHPIDSFIAAKIQQALKDSSGENLQQAEAFHDNVLPILRDHCFRCHGDKQKGGLRLNSRDAVLMAGDSDWQAVVPGDPEESELMARLRSDDESLRMPPTERGLTDQQIAQLETWIRDGVKWPAPPVDESQLKMSPLVTDERFLRRVFLDTVGVPPTPDEAATFLEDASADRRERLIDRLLADKRGADHWIGEWLDILAENPTLLNASLNSTGPFRWFLYDSLRDHKALDRMVTELILMRGGRHEGGSAGFSMAAENDAPMAAKGHIVAAAFLGIELQCARCHDSPYHSTMQRDLYSLAAMFSRQTVTVPATSRVPDAFFAKKEREALIQATLKPDEPIDPVWPFADVTGAVDGPDVDRLMHDPSDTRERLAALITSPHNQRFPRVIVNRIWKRLIGAGIVQPVQDWEGRNASHAALLDWLAHQLVRHDYDTTHIVRLILTSKTYQRQAVGHNQSAVPELRFFNSPDRRRLSAEQVVDSLHVAVGAPLRVEELTFVHDGRRPLSNRLTLGQPSRSWMFASLNNERDRPSLSLPRAQSVSDVLEAFGWTGSRQMPIHQRETDPNVLQPGVLANGTLSMTLTRASAGSRLAQLAVQAESAETLVDSLFLRILTRRPKPAERAAFTKTLGEGFSTRLVSDADQTPSKALPPLPRVTWFNHLQSEANTIQQEVERRIRSGPPPDPRLQSAWREKYEDAVWSLVNHREFVWVP